jgi:hypothetical protein
MIAIKGMEMPDSCYDCHFAVDEETNDYGSFCKCGILEDYETINLLEHSKHHNCPLVEIVTCKDCKHRKKVHPDWKHDKKAEVYFCTLQSDEYCYEVKDDYFCKDGERKE